MLSSSQLICQIEPSLGQQEASLALQALQVERVVLVPEAAMRRLAEQQGWAAQAKVLAELQEWQESWA
jgi:hypothetical protein